MSICSSEAGVHFIFCFIPNSLQALHKGAWNTTGCWSSGVSYLDSVDIGGQVVAGGCPVHCRLLSSTPELYPLKTRSTPSFTCDDPECLQLLKVGRTENENHPWLRLSGVYLEVGPKKRPPGPRLKIPTPIEDGQVWPFLLAASTSKTWTTYSEVPLHTSWAAVQTRTHWWVLVRKWENCNPRPCCPRRKWCSRCGKVLPVAQKS